MQTFPGPARWQATGEHATRQPTSGKAAAAASCSQRCPKEMRGHQFAVWEEERELSEGGATASVPAVRLQCSALRSNGRKSPPTLFALMVAGRRLRNFQGDGVEHMP